MRAHIHLYIQKYNNKYTCLKKRNPNQALTPLLQLQGIHTLTGAAYNPALLLFPQANTHRGAHAQITS